MKIREFTIQQTIIATMTAILAVSVIVAVVLVYSIIAGTTNDLVNNQASEINKQIVLNYENYTSGVINMSNILQNKLIDLDTAYEENEVESLFSLMEEMERDTTAIALFDNSGNLIMSTAPVVVAQKDIALMDWFKNAVYDDNIIHFSSPYQQYIFEIPTEEVITISTVVEYFDMGRSKKGVLMIDLNFEGLSDLSDISNLGDEGHLLILDADDAIVYSTDLNLYGYDSYSYDLARDTIFGSANATIDSQSMAVNINTISATRWRIATFQNVHKVSEGFSRALMTVILLSLVTILVTIVVAYLVAGNIIKPLKKLDKAIIHFQEGVYDAKVTVQGQKEIKIVTVGFNAMIDKIHQLMDEVVREQEGKRKSEINVLQNQINPHFLYNTLDCMIWLAERNRNEDLVNAVTALSTYFRVSLSKGKQFIPISEELRHIESYMLIQSLRYNDSFEYSIHCDSEAMDIKIMKLILQPLVENAIYHGIDKDDEDSYIRIEVMDKADEVHLSVTNSGYGITDAKIEEIHKTLVEGNERGSVGMKNVYQRLKLFYGDEAKVVIESELDESTTISLVIPKNRLMIENNSTERGLA